jgi:hypothetical protein
MNTEQREELVALAVEKRISWKSYSKEESRFHVSTRAPTDLSVVAQVQATAFPSMY